MAYNPHEPDDQEPDTGPFDPPAQATPLTEEQKLERLEGYISVPPDYWPFIKYGTHVRFVEKDTGKFVIGGFVIKNPFDVKPKTSPTKKRFLRLQNGFNPKAPGYRAWIVAYEDIAFMFAKGTGVELALRNDLHKVTTTFRSNIKKLVDYCKTLEARISKLETR